MFVLHQKEAEDQFFPDYGTGRSRIQTEILEAWKTLIIEKYKMKFSLTYQDIARGYIQAPCLAQCA